jgi:tetratricopeptide (TPR) repeat protein
VSDWDLNLSKLMRRPLFILSFKIIYIMKKTFLPTIMSVFVLCATLLHIGCQNTEKQENELSTEKIEVEELKKRDKKLGFEEEEKLYRSKYNEFVAKINKDPQDLKSWLGIAEIFIAEARITGDHPYYYPAALEVINHVLSKKTMNPEIEFQALSLKSSVQLSFHQFKEGLVTAKKAITINSYNATIYGALVDANVELGNYNEAVNMADKMVSIRPDLQSYSRVSYLREIHGDYKGAIDAMNMAVKAGYPGYESTAWARYTLARIYETYGDLQNAEMNYKITLQERPNYAFAMDGMASIEMKKGNLKSAEKWLNDAIAILPEVSFYENLVEIYQSTNRQAEADALIQKMMTMMAEDEASGHKMDLEKAKVHLNLSNKLNESMKSATIEYKARPNNIDVNLLMGQISIAKGDFKEAKKHIDVALLTKSNKPELLICKGLIESNNGDVKLAKESVKKAFSLDPYLTGTLAVSAKKVL